MSILYHKTSSHPSNYESIDDILYEFPIGIIIIQSNTTNKLNKESTLVFANNYSRHLFSIPNDNDMDTFMDNISVYKEYTPGEVVSSSLRDAILNINREEIAKVYISPSRELIYVKMKYTSSKILLSIDDLQEERRVLQSNFIRKVNYKYLLTLYHEINNPLNSLVASVNEIIQKSESITIIIKRITLLVLLIQFFIKNFILYFQVSMMMINSDMTNEAKSTFHLDSLLKQIAKKYETIYEYKKILYQQNTEALINKATTLNYFYFKALLKMIFSYYYYILDSGLCFVIQCEEIDQSTLKLIFKNENSTEILSGSFTSKDNNDFEEDSSTTEDEIKKKNKVQTIDMIIATMNQLSNMLNLKITHLNNGHIIISLIIPYENDYQLFNESDYTELSPNHSRVFRMIDRSLSKVSLTELKNTIRASSPEQEIEKNKDELYSPTIYPAEDIKLYSIKKRNTIFVPLLSSNTKQSCKNGYKEDKKIRSFKKLNSANQYPKKKYFQLIDNSLCRLDYDNNDFMQEVSNMNMSLNAKSRTLFKNLSQKLNKKKKWKNVLVEDERMRQFKDSRMTFENIKNEFKCFNLNTINNQVKAKEENDRIMHIVPSKKNSESLKSKFSDITNISFKLILDNYLSSSILPSISPKNKSTYSITCQCNDVLIVDDEPFNLSCLTNLLFKSKITSDTANDGKECLEKVLAKVSRNCSCNKSSYKLVLLDILMPKINGIEAAEEIMKFVQLNAIPKSISIIFISACLDKEKTIDDIIKKIPIVKGFLPKPIKKTKIEELLKCYYKADIDM